MIAASDESTLEVCRAEAEAETKSASIPAIEAEQPAVETTAAADWWRAVNLQERIDLLRATGSTGQADYALGAKRLARWRALPAFADQAFFERRLNASGLSVEDFERLLGAAPNELAAQSGDVPPAWATGLEGLLDEEPAADALTRDLNAGLMKSLAPVARKAIARLLKRIEQFPQDALPFRRDTAAAVFLPALLTRFAVAASRTVTLELHVARLREQLEGETPEARFRHFTTLLAQPGFLWPILREYSVLTRYLTMVANQWVVHTTEILERLAADWDALRGSLLPEEPGLLTSVVGEAGDTHRDGRSVAILVFASGARVVYKPRPLSVDVHFNALLQWLNDRGHAPYLEGVAVLDRGTYGWAKYMEPAGCADDAAVERFYRRQGSLLALLYALEATDFHHENLIAAGEHPKLVDLESLFQQRPRTGSATIDIAAGEAFAQSVMRIGLLPQRIWSTDDRETGVDISGLSGEGGQLTPFPVLTFENAGTDEMKAVRKRMRISGASNLPTVGGRAPRVEDHVEEVVAGFEATYRLLIEHRADLLAASGPLAAFATDKIRVVLRNTRTYSMLLNESFHPDVLRDAEDRARLFERLWGRAQADPQIFRAIPAEIRDVERGDIPMFVSQPGSRDLWTSDGERLEDYFDASSYDSVRHRISTFDEADLQRQTWFINASIASMTLGVAAPETARRVEAPTRQLTPQGIEAAVRAVADRIETLAIRGTNDVNWIGLTLIGGRQWTLLPLAYDLYSGVLGPTLFLAHAGELLGEARYTDLARVAFEGVLRRVAELGDGADSSRMSAGGGYSGPGAMLHTLAILGKLWRDERCLAEAERLLPYVAEFIPRDDAYDVIGGSAGSILNVLALWRATGSPRALDVAREAGDYLLARSEVMPRGIAWSNRYEQSQPLAGFSHGASGIAHALLSLGAATGDVRYSAAARGALEYERGIYSPKHRNWPDFRTDSGPAEEGVLRVMTAWCHGAPGIGLARLTAAATLGEAWIDEDLDVAAETTFAGFGASDSICHGDLGNAEFLQRLARFRGDGALQQRLEEKIAPIVARIASGVWYCGTPRAAETPGLMSGLAGIGYGLLRFLHPELPSFLTLDDGCVRAAGEGERAR